jgi:hypothetical protein
MDKQKQYDRLTERRETPLTMSMWGGSSRDLKIYNRLAELEDKIEQGEIIIPKFAINQEVFYIGYKSIEYECPHCGEPCYKEEVDGVRKGIILERTITDKQGEIDIVYTILIEGKNGLKLFTQRKEDIFLTCEEAENKLKELQEKKE